MGTWNLFVEFTTFSEEFFFGGYDESGQCIQQFLSGFLK